MTTVAVLADPPRPGLVLPELAETTPLGADEVASLYGAMLKDVCRAVEASGGDLLVNYRPDDTLPAEHVREQSVEAELRATIGSALAAPDDARFERQVGSTFAARAGNTVTHLLEREGVNTAAVVEPTAAFLTRQVVDSAAMKLRRSDVVLGPSTGGRVYYAGFGAPIDFEDAYVPPAVETLTDRAIDGGLDVDYLGMEPVIESSTDLVTALPVIAARRRADRIRPEHTASFLAEIGVHVEQSGSELTIVRE